MFSFENEPCNNQSKRYKKHGIIGSGTYGEVKLVTDLINNKTVAIKKIKLLVILYRNILNFLGSE